MGDEHQPLLQPPDVQDFVPEGHVSRFIVELVWESRDLKEITGSNVRGARFAAVRPADDGDPLIAQLCERAVFVATDRECLT